MNASNRIDPAAADTAREITAQRVFDAPRERVFDAWTDAAHISNWWGPEGFTTTTQSMDARPGGEWRFIMHGPDGRDYPNRIVYIEVTRPERLVYRHAGTADTEAVNFHVTVTFTALRAQTKVDVRMVFETAAERDRVAREYGAIEGLHDTLTRLARHLAGR